MAVPKCWEASCVGKEAAEMGCDTDQMKMGTATPGAADGAKRDVILYYSNACHALWGYYFTTDPDSLVGFAVYSQPMYGGRETAVQKSPLHSDFDNYTTMVAWGQSTKACYQYHPGVDPEPRTQHDDGHAPDCTLWY